MSQFNIRVVLSAIDAGFSPVIARAGVQLQSFGKLAQGSLTNTNASVMQLERTAGRASLVIGAALAGGLALSTKNAIGFEKAMRNANTILRETAPNGDQLKLTEKQFQHITAAVLDMSRTVPQSAKALSEGLYDIASSGFAGQDALDILKQSAIAASAGLTDTATSARAITAILNAYGLSAAHAGDVSDTLFQTVNVGVVTFEQLSNSVGDFVGNASLAGVSIADAGAALATMTLSGVQADQAGVVLNRTLAGLIQPSAALSQEMAVLDIKLDDLKKAGGLKQVFDKLRVASKGNVQVLQEWFPEIRNMRGAAALMANQGLNMARSFDLIADPTKRAGAAQQAFNEQSKSAAFQMNLAKNQLTALSIAIGSTLAPKISSAAKEIGGFAQGFTLLPGPMKKVIGFAALLTTGITLIGGAMLLMVPRIAALNAGLAELGVGFAISGASIGAIAAPLILVTGLLAIGGFALAEHGKKTAQAKAESQAYTEALKAEAEGVKGATAAAVESQLLQRDLIGLAIKYKISLTDVKGAANGNADALDRVTAAIARQRAALTGKVDGPKTFGGKNGFDQQQKDRRDAAGLGRLSTGIKELSANNRKSKVEFDALAKSTDKVGASATDAFGGIARMKDGMADTSAAAAALKGQLESLSAVQKSFFSAVQGAAQKIFPDITASSGQPGNPKKAKSSGKSEAQRALDVARAEQGIQSALRDSASAYRAVADAETALNDERERQTGARDLARAEIALASALAGSERATFSLLDAEQKLADLRDNQASGRSLEEIQNAVTRARLRSAEATVHLADAVDTLHAAQDHGTPKELEAAQRGVQSAQLDLRDASFAADDATKALSRAQGQNGSIARDVASAQMDLASAQRDLRGSALDAKDAAFALVDAQRALADNRALVDATRTLSDAAFALKQSLLAVRESHVALADAQKKEGSAGADAAVSSNKKVKLSLEQYQAELEKNIKAHTEWADNLQRIAKNPQYGPAVAVMLAKLGQDGAGYVKKLADDTGHHFGRFADDMIQASVLGTDTFNLNLTTGLGTAGNITKAQTAAMAAGLVLELGLGVDTALKILQTYQTGLTEVSNTNFKAPSGATLTKRGVTDLTYGYDSVQNKKGYGGTASAPRNYENSRVGANAMGDVKDAHSPEIAAGGSMRVWAEPETGGEAYIPFKDDHRRPRAVSIWKEVGKRLGMRGAGGDARYFANGGIAPTEEMFGSIGQPPLAKAAFGAAKALYERYQALRGPGAVGSLAADPLAGSSDGLRGIGYRAILEYMDRTGIPYRASSTVRQNSITSSGNISLHDPRRGAKAADLVGPDKMAIFQALLRHKDQMQELFFTPAGFSIKNGQRVAPIAAADHYDHVHAATFDRGGWLQPGHTMAYNGTGRAEWIPNPNGGGGGGINVQSGAVSVTVRVDAGVDTGAVTRAVNDAVRPAFSELVTSLERQLTGRGA